MLVIVFSKSAMVFLELVKFRIKKNPPTPSTRITRTETIIGMSFDFSALGGLVGIDAGCTVAVPPVKIPVGEVLGVLIGELLGVEAWLLSGEVLGSLPAVGFG